MLLTRRDGWQRPLCHGVWGTPGRREPPFPLARQSIVIPGDASIRRAKVRKRRILFACLPVVVVAGIPDFSLASATSSKGASSVTLTYVDDIYTDPVSSAAQKQMIQIFEKQNPGVTVKYVPKPFSQWVPTAKLALQGS